jgi:hypothetical protein
MQELLPQMKNQIHTDEMQKRILIYPCPSGSTWLTAGVCICGKFPLRDLRAFVVNRFLCGLVAAGRPFNFCGW